MTDNTQVNTGAGDTIRDIDRSLNAVPISAKTQVVQLDAGGQSGESLVNAGNPMPIYSPYDLLVAKIGYQELLATQAATINGFIPMETPSFLLG